MEFKIWSCFSMILLISSCIDAGKVKNSGKVHSRPSSGGYHPSHSAPAPATGWNVPPAHTATHHNPSQSYNPSSGYHPPPNTGYHPPPNTGYHPPSNTGYNHPPAQAPPQTIIVESEKRGLGTLVKEAAVGAVVGVGVNAVVNRVLPGGIYGNNHPGYAAAPAPAAAPAAPGVTHTEIINNYYGNGTGPAPGDPGQAPPNSGVPQQVPGQYPQQVPGQYPAQPPSGNYYGQPQNSVTYRTNSAETMSISKCSLIIVTICMFVFVKVF
ncbi:splicing factor 3A subunit 2-like isoform X3 [Cotesia glomerata]|uniref:splicing factor 3A subunit 2-like isoform X3 n=1 Tax=Cotesia glomerata TaxID=32391 RepID=UPI001D003F71|nr:splicing factor 3A subunit 2-like isoform X3 [Cotesia glomerata]